MFTIEPVWDKQHLADINYAPDDIMSSMMLYRILAQENAEFNPAADKLSFDEVEVSCGVCLTDSYKKKAPEPAPFPIDNFELRFRGPLNAESKNLVACPGCGARITICGDTLEMPEGNEAILILYLDAAPPDYLAAPFHLFPRFNAGKINPATPSDETPAPDVKPEVKEESVTPSEQYTEKRWWEFWK